VRVSLPEAALLPLQPPLAVQLLVLALVQDNVVEPPAGMLLGFAFRSTLGAAGGAATLTVTDLLVLAPALLLQVSEKVLLAVREPRASDPAVALVPDQAPEAVHEAALVVDQLKVLLP
jgi:hypothetical protein